MKKGAFKIHEEEMADGTKRFSISGQYENHNFYRFHGGKVLKTKKEAKELIEMMRN